MPPNRKLCKAARMGGQDGCQLYPRTVTDHGIVDLYRRARLPQPAPVSPLEADTVRRIEELYSKVAVHFQE